MHYRIRILASLLTAAFCLSAHAQTAESPETPEIEPEALSVLQAMSDFLAASDEFYYEIDTTYDVVQPSGVKYEFGVARKNLVARPDRLHTETIRRNGVAGTMIFDGKHIWAYSKEANVYAQTEQVGDLVESIEFAVSELRIKAPLSEIASPDLFASITRDLETAYHLGENVVRGVTSDHLFLRNDYADVQLWVATGDEPLLQRIVIDYREERGQPQFRAQFSNWNMAPKNTREKFTFVPPKDAERIRFYVAAPPSDSNREDAK